MSNAPRLIRERIDPQLTAALFANYRTPVDAILELVDETALREVCVTIPEATVQEFERKVNELMLVSLSLAQRRRGRRRPAAVPQPRLL